MRSASWRSKTSLERRPQQILVERAADPDGERRVVGDAPRLELVEEQELLLGKGQRVARARRRRGIGGRRRAGAAGRPASARRGAAARAQVDLRGEARERRLLEQRADRELDLAPLARLGDHARREQRVAAEVEEAVFGADALAAREPRCQISAISSSVGVCGAREPSGRACFSQTGGGSALRSVLPLRVSGSRSSTMIDAGTM